MSESNFIQKVGAACNKKEDLYQKSKYDVSDGGYLSKENSLEESAGNSSLLYLL